MPSSRRATKRRVRRRDKVKKKKKSPTSKLKKVAVAALTHYAAKAAKTACRAHPLCAPALSLYESFGS